MTIITDIQKLSPGTIVDLFVLDSTEIGGSLLRFHAMNTAHTIMWQGNAYLPYPVEMDGFEQSGDKQSPRPSIKVANVTGMISSMLKSLDDLINAKVIRKRTLAQYLDAANTFITVNTDPDPLQEFPDEVWFIDRKSSENKYFVTFELAAPWDVQGYQLPGRPCNASICSWRYRSAECSYQGGPVADALDNPVNLLQDDVCGLRISSCKLRFGTKVNLPFGAFPAVGIIR